MGNNSKNAMIAMLLGALVVMAVAYAAFSTALTINGTATINSSWNVKFDSTKTSGTGVIATTTGFSGGTAPLGGTIAYSNSDTTATLGATLYQPGDKVEYTLTVENTGSLDAVLGTPTMTIVDSTGSCTGSGTSTVCKSTAQHVQFTIGAFSTTDLDKNGGTATIKVTAQFLNTSVSTLTSGEQLKVKVDFTATQA